tara:strand:- start:658 stop:1770 length:1113 start_codon:yes stop_codon:yes gene_type:complete
VGTVKSTLNSAISLSKYSKDQFKVKIINTCGEWDDYLNIFKDNNIDVVNLSFKFFHYLPKNGFLKSRISYMLIILFSALPLVKLLKKEKPEFIILHLITSLPLILNNIFNFKTKFILRISGFPKLNFFRKNLWKISSKNIFKVTCPTQDLLSSLKDKKIFSEKKILFLQDAILNLQEYVLKNKKISSIKYDEFNNYFLSVGRLTKQKNYSFLISEFYKHIKKNKKDILLIIGEGEEKQKLQNLINTYNLRNSIFLLGKRENVYPYMKRAKALILSSLWEEVGFVIVEAAFSNLFVISSDCPNGPREFLEDGKAGYLFKSDKENELVNKLQYFKNNESDLTKFKINAKKNSSRYTLFRHYKNLKQILTNED